MTVRASISWDRAAQELGYQVKGVLGDIVLKRLKKVRDCPTAAGDVNMETDDAGCPHTPTPGTIEPIPPVDDSPEMSRGKLDIMCDEATNVLGSLNRSVTKGDTSRRLDEKMKTVNHFKGNLMAAGLNQDASEAQRTRVAEIAIWMDEAKNSAKKLKKDRNNKSKEDGDGKGTPTAEKQGPKRDPSTTSSNLNRFTMKQSRLGDAITPKQAPP
jgi:hypothetical protein